MKRSKGIGWGEGNVVIGMIVDSEDGGNEHLQPTNEYPRVVVLECSNSSN